jgi:hypothetical protein
MRALRGHENVGRNSTQSSSPRRPDVPAPTYTSLAARLHPRHRSGDARRDRIGAARTAETPVLVADQRKHEIARRILVEMRVRRLGCSVFSIGLCCCAGRPRGIRPCGDFAIR